MSPCQHAISAAVPKPALSILVTVEPSGAVHADVIAYELGTKRGAVGHTTCFESGPFDLVTALPAWLEDQVVRWMLRNYPRL